jgi:hypothetical protein
MEVDGDACPGCVRMEVEGTGEGLGTTTQRPKTMPHVPRVVEVEPTTVVHHRELDRSIRMRRDGDGDVSWAPVTGRVVDGLLREGQEVPAFGHRERDVEGAVRLDGDGGVWKEGLSD